MHKFQDKNILITGASSGIGKCLAKELRALGANVIGVGKREQISDDSITYISADLSSYDSINQICNVIQEPIDYFFCNAGMAYEKTFENLNSEEILDQLNINLNTPILLLKSLLENKKLNPGSQVIFTSSLCGVYPMPKLSIYSSTKFGVEGFIGSLRKELKDYKFTIVRPGIVLTEFFDKAGMGDFKKLINKKRYMVNTPEEVADKIIREINRDVIILGSDNLFIALEKFVPNRLKNKLLSLTNYFNRMVR